MKYNQITLEIKTEHFARNYLSYMRKFIGKRNSDSEEVFNGLIVILENEAKRHGIEKEAILKRCKQKICEDIETGKNIMPTLLAEQSRVFIEKYLKGNSDEADYVIDYN